VSLTGWPVRWKSQKVFILDSDRKPIVPTSTPVAPSLNIPLLDRLRAAEGDYVPLDELGPDLPRLRCELDALATFGFGVEQHPYRGAAYRGPAARLCPDQIEHALATRRIGRRIAVWNRVTSTNDLAARAGRSPSNDGLVVLADEQTAGRGRRGRAWTAPPCSSILMSVVVFPPRHLASNEAEFGCAWLTALGAVATAELVTSWTGRDAKIKWPNDIRIDGRKIAGILVERVSAPVRPESTGPPGAIALARWGAVIGIGLNVNLNRDGFPAELAVGATSMQIEAGGESFDRSEVARDLIRRLDHWYDSSRSRGVEILNAPWQARSEHRGGIVRIATTTGCLRGRLVEIDLRLGLALAVANEPTRESCFGSTRRLTRVPIADILTLEGESSDPDFHELEDD
jgi:BirA family transcriptional regulator, biotin operon repressor / biotin---[acetyl-CoA-carboxylase] ligase